MKSTEQTFRQQEKLEFISIFDGSIDILATNAKSFSQ